MRVAFVTAQAQVSSGTQFASGPANYLLRVARSLSGRGHSIVIFAVGDKDEYKNEGSIEFITVGIKDPSRFQRIFAGVRHPHAYYSKLLNRRLWEYHKKKQFDLIQYTSYRATALYRPHDVPAVMRISSFRPMWDKALGENVGKPARRRATRLEEASMQKVDMLYAPSRFLADAVSEAIGRKVFVIEPPFFIEEDIIEDKFPEKIDNSRFLLFAGSFTRRKGLHVIGAIIESFLRDYPNLVFAFAGRDKKYTADATMLSYIRKKAGKFADRVVYLGKIPHSQLFTLLPRAEAVVLPSLVDNLPNTCLEAMATGGVVIGTRGASFEQLIEDGVNGYLVEPDDAGSLRSAIDRAFKLKSEERNTISDRAKRRMEEMHPDKVIPRLIELYEKTISLQKRE
ncbi:MAG: glycosyltransferase family 4 protein [Spirochaetaceae bacterium]|nr:glycosyltransferase family 4 protein [Spirochaetaceae bacterium]MCF7949355.1 glycosyltransferase family 4 protein [Spirochaetia bacterium]